MLVEHLKVQLVRPPVTVRARVGSAREGALARTLFVSLCVHATLRSWLGWLNRCVAKNHVAPRTAA